VSTQKSVARHGQGKSNGYRAIIALKIDETAFFIYGFAINDLGNIDSKKLKVFKQFRLVLYNKELFEVIHNTANGLYDFGIIDGKTMGQYDAI